MKFRPILIIVIIVGLAGALVLGGATWCSTTSRTTRGAGIGAASGAVLGGLIGNANGSTTRGAIIGAVVGGAAGALIGRQMDERAREIERAVPGARVERVGEGIEVTFPSGFLFDFDSDRIRGDAAANLNELARHLARYQDSNIMIAGHTDSVGSTTYNQDLSIRRAESAARYLAAHGVTNHIETVGLGEREPVASNRTDAGRQENRRVEVAIYASAAAQEDARRQAGAR